MKVLIFSLITFIFVAIIYAKPKDDVEDQSLQGSENTSQRAFSTRDHNLEENIILTFLSKIAVLIDDVVTKETSKTPVEVKTSMEDPDKLSSDLSIPNKIEQRQCEDECVFEFLVPFCYVLDIDAYCPNGFACCLSEGSNIPTATPRPTPAPKCEHNSTATKIERPQTTSTTEKPIKITTVTAQTIRPTQKVETSTKSATVNEGGTCPGICVDDEIAVVCGLITDGFCKTGTKCCVPTHSYPNEIHNKFFAAKNNE
ncbi:protein masquerade-like [Sitodiplosis mosellana]|uniref:protein masquerade-like n=1 Tax=Sitodiplosis mosellana TaxID=263140 RepID=UPI002445129C|nr:protein masquerade-like [Sitodiplosis mosellana]